MLQEAAWPNERSICSAASRQGFMHLNCAFCMFRLRCRGVGATICCPGPLATGGDGKPRLVYGPRGLIQQASPACVCPMLLCSASPRLSFQHEGCGLESHHGCGLCTPLVGCWDTAPAAGQQHAPRICCRFRYVFSAGCHGNEQEARAHSARSGPDRQGGLSQAGQVPVGFKVDQLWGITASVCQGTHPGVRC